MKNSIKYGLELVINLTQKKARLHKSRLLERLSLSAKVLN